MEEDILLDENIILVEDDSSDLESSPESFEEVIYSLDLESVTFSEEQFTILLDTINSNNQIIYDGLSLLNGFVIVLTLLIFVKGFYIFFTKLLGFDLF